MSSIKPKPQNNFLSNFLIHILPLSHYHIVGDSMYPVFSDGDTVVVNRLAYIVKKPRLLDIVACQDPRDGKVLIKRITKISGNKFYITGENKSHSTDSREFGMIEKPAILGKVLRKL